VGSTTAASNTGTYNTAIGYSAMLSNTTGSSNISVGVNALTANTTGNYNISVGKDSLISAQTAAGNVGIGHEALRSTTAGSNTALGYQAGYAGTANTTGSNNTFIGYQAQANANNYTNGTALGNGAILTASNSIVLGDTSISAIYAQVTSITAISDARRKKDITDADLGLDFINKLRPVQYRFKNGDDSLRYGLIAQDVEKALPDAYKPLVNKNEDGIALLMRENDKDHTYRLTYGELTAPIIKAIQDLYKMVMDFMGDIKDQIAQIILDNKRQDDELNALRDEIKTLKQEIKEMKESMGQGAAKTAF
jgi:hypothetical protein